MKPCLFLVEHDTVARICEYGESLSNAVNMFIYSFSEQNIENNPELLKIMLLDSPSLAEFKRLRHNAVNVLLWNKLLDTVDFETFYDPSIRESLISVDTPLFTMQSAQQFLDQYGLVNEYFKHSLAREITALIDAGKWDKDILEDGKVIGMRFNYPAVIQLGGQYKLDEDLKRIMLRLDFMSLAESGESYDQQGAIQKINESQRFDELHFNLGYRPDRIHLMAYKSNFTLMAGNHMEDLVTREEYLAAAI